MARADASWSGARWISPPPVAHAARSACRRNVQNGKMKLKISRAHCRAPLPAGNMTNTGRGARLCALFLYVSLFLCVQIAVSSEPLESRIKTLAQKSGAQSVGIYYRGYDGKVFAYNADESFHAASTMKVPVLMEVFRLIDTGKLKIDQQVTLKNQFHSI